MDCNIVFSGVFPIGGQRGPESHHLWRLAVDLGARPSMVMNNFPITHLVIHPGRLGTQKHVQAKATPKVFVVTPEWILKCARTWSRASEKDFLADEWKVKQEKLAQEAEKAAEIVTEVPAVPVVSVIPDPTTIAAAVPVESIAPEQVKQVVEEVAQAPAATISTGNGENSEESVVSASAAKKRKAVSFAADVPGEDEEEETKDGEKSTVGAASTIFPSSSNSRQRRVPVRRVIGGARVGGVRIPEQKGVVASGGTFDFLSKITQIGASKRVTETAAKPVVSSKPAAPQPVKVMNDLCRKNTGQSYHYLICSCHVKYPGRR